MQMKVVIVVFRVVLFASFTGKEQVGLRRLANFSLVVRALSIY